MIKKFLPQKMYRDIYLLTPEYMKAHNLKGIITDLDNTLIRWDKPDATPEIRAWFQQFIDAGIQVVVCSNNNEKRVKIFADQVGLPFVFKARKPLVRGFKRAQQLMGLESHEIIVIGDQLMTDVFGGNRGGFHTILVAPLVKTDEWKTYLNRKMEKVIMRRFQKKNLANWEEHS